MGKGRQTAQTRRYEAIFVLNVSAARLLSVKPLHCLQGLNDQPSVGAI